MAGILGLSDQGFKTTMTDTLRALVGKAGSTRNQVGNVSRETEIPRQDQIEMLEVKASKWKCRTSLMGLIGHD